MYHGAKNKLRLNQTFDCLAWRLFTSTSTSAGKRRNAAATFEKHGSFELSVLQLESIKHRIKLIQSKTILGAPWMKWLNIYLQWPWQQKWVQQLQGERWRTGLDEGLNTKQLDFFTDSCWVTFSDLMLFLFERWHSEPGWGGWGGWSPASQPPRPPSHPPAPEDVWSMASHISYTEYLSTTSIPKSSRRCCCSCSPARYNPTGTHGQDPIGNHRRS